MVTRMGTVGLRTTDLEAMVSFAERITGLFEVERRDGVSYMTSNAYHHELVLIESDEDSCDHIGLEVTDGEALAEAERVLTGAGFAVAEPSYEEAGIADSLWVIAPGGLPVRLFHGMDRSGPRAYDTAGVRPVKFEHVTVTSSVKEDLEKFLVLLGMRLSDRTMAGDNPMAWYRPGVDHHGVAIVAAPVDGLQHFGWTARSWDDFRRLGDRLAENREGFILGPVHHGIGDNYSCYFRDPSGMIVEYSNSIMQIEDDAAYEPGSWPDEPFTANRWLDPLPSDEFRKSGSPYHDLSQKRLGATGT
jgi:catechol 2,3-dioxygenase-like lactoylglutathione lyase family enzyme